MFCSTSSKNAEHEWNCTEENATMTIARHHASNLKILGGQDRPGFSWAHIKVVGSLLDFVLIFIWYSSANLFISLHELPIQKN